MGISREFRGAFRQSQQKQEQALRNGARALMHGRTVEAEQLIFPVLDEVATRLAERFHFADDADELVARWSQDGRGANNLVAGARALSPDEPRNVMLARLTTFLRSRALDFWRKRYAQENQLAQFFWVRMGKAVMDSLRLVERDGVVGLRIRPNAGPGNADVVVRQLHLLMAPTAPRLIEGGKRLRLPRGANDNYERWMVECIRIADGKLSRRRMAELLARVYGDSPRYPGAGDDVEMSDEERRTDQERAARWVNSEKEE